MRSTRPLAMLLLTSACAASVDSPSAACRENPYYCGRAMLVDDAAEAGLVPRAVPPAPAPPPTAAGPGLVTKLAPLAPVVLVSQDAKPAGTDTAAPEVDAARKQPPKPKQTRVSAPQVAKPQPKPRPGEGPPGDPPCSVKGTGGSGQFRSEKAPPGWVRCDYLCKGVEETITLQVWGKSGMDCYKPESLSKAAREAAKKKAMEGR